MAKFDTIPLEKFPHLVRARYHIRHAKSPLIPRGTVVLPTWKKRSQGWREQMQAWAESRGWRVAWGEVLWSDGTRTTFTGDQIHGY